MDSSQAIAAIYEDHRDVETAIRALQHAGFDITALSIAGKDFLSDGPRVGDYDRAQLRKPWGTLWTFWGGMWDRLMGRAFFFTPDIGPVLVAGPLGDVIAKAAGSPMVGGGFSIVGAGLCSLGIPKSTVLDYELAIRADKLLLVAHGSGEAVARAKEILAARVATGRCD